MAQDVVDVAEVSLPEAPRVPRNVRTQRRVPREAFERGEARSWSLQARRDVKGDAEEQV